jgi:hypothetical protein
MTMKRMSKHANFTIYLITSDRLIIRDEGPWDKHFTVTNDAEWVVEQLAPLLNGRRLLYFDSEYELDELVVKNGKFKGFRAYRNSPNSCFTIPVRDEMP